ncbi:MAG: radical SAM protein [Lachnospiraceae bacterium]|nr:radical SAM protein [Lachnospiraceae bacterium]
MEKPKARDPQWREKEPSYKEVVARYPDLPATWILKADLQRRGLYYTEAATRKIDPAIHATNSDVATGFRENRDYVPEGLIWKDGSYLIANFDFDQKQPARDPYTIDVVNDRIVVVDEDEVLEEIEGFWEKPDFYDKKASNGEPLRKYVQARPQRLDISMNHYCHFWDEPGEGCKYCPLSPSYLAAGKKEERYDFRYVKEALTEAVKQKGRFSAIMLTGGSQLSGSELLDDELEGYLALLKIIGEIFDGDRVPTQLISSAFNERQLERLKNETKLLTYTTDIEVLNKEKFEWICPGKARHIGYDEWKRRLFAAVDIFGKGNVSSGVVLGVELAEGKGFTDEDEAFRAVTEEAESIISHGIALAANIWRPAPKSILQNGKAASLDYFVRTYREFDRLQHKYCPNPYTDDFRRCGAHVGLDLMRV